MGGEDVKKKRTILLALAAGISVGAVFGGLMIAGAIGGGDASTKPPEKSAIETAEAFRQLTADAGYHAPKPAAVTSVPTQASCPEDTSTVSTKITGPTIQLPPGSSDIFSQITVVNGATAVGSDAHPYSLYVGNMRSDPSAWVVVRWRGPKDPCLEGQAGFSPELITVPAQGAAIMLTKIDENILYFSTSDGRAGGFNYTTKTFLPLAP